MPHRKPVARRMFELTEPIAMVNFCSPEPNDAMEALGLRGYWNGYFAGRSAPLGRVPAEVVHAAFYNFGPGEAARHIPKVWDTTTPEAAHDAREQGCVVALERSSATSWRRLDSPAPPSCSGRRRPARRPAGGSCTPASAPSRCPTNP